MSEPRSHSLYVTTGAYKGAETAAILMGLNSPDEWADFILREALAKIPEVAEETAAIRQFLSDRRKAWKEKYGR